MHIAVLTLRFRLPGCNSLKDKRQRLSGLRDRFGRQAAIAVCESDLSDSLQSAEWSFVALGSSPATATNVLDGIEKFVQESIDALVVGRQLEIL